MSYKICPGTTTPATKTLSASTGITLWLCTSVLRKGEKFNHCRLDTPKMRHVFLLLVVAKIAPAVCLNNTPDMTRAWVTLSAVSQLLKGWRYTPVSKVIFIQWFAYLNQIGLICVWHKFPIQSCISFVESVCVCVCVGGHCHKALGPLYFPTTISNNSSGTVTQQSVKEINNQIWHSSPISPLLFICLAQEKKT